MKNNFGFTILDLLVTVAILGILASLALPKYNNFIEKARLAEAVTTISALYTMQKSYELEFNGITNNLVAIGYTAEGTIRYECGLGGAYAYAPLDTFGLSGGYAGREYGFTAEMCKSPAYAAKCAWIFDPAISSGTGRGSDNLWVFFPASRTFTYECHRHLSCFGCNVWNAVDSGVTMDQNKILKYKAGYLDAR